MDEKSFCVTLLSNTISHSETNTLAKFRNQMKDWIHLTGEYEVGLYDISYTYTIYNISSDQIIKYTAAPGVTLPATVVLRAGYYKSLNVVLDKLNETVKGAFPRWKEPPKFQYDEITGLCKYIKGEDADGMKIDVVLSEDIKAMLGFWNRRPANLWENDHSLFVYTNIIKHRLVGDSKSQLLRVVEISKRNFGEQNTEIYNPPQYHPLISNSFESIEIEIRSKSGELVKFLDGHIVIVLHFKKIVNHESLF